MTATDTERAERFRQAARTGTILSLHAQARPDQPALLSAAGNRTFGQLDGNLVALNQKTGEVWLALFGGGLARFSAGRFDHFHQLNSGLVNDVVYGVAVENDNVWCATTAGASRQRLVTPRQEPSRLASRGTHQSRLSAATGGN